MRPDRYRSGFSAGASPCSCTVYGDRGLSKTSAVRPASCTRPSLSTTISSVRSAAIARSCVISSRLMPSEDCSSVSRSRMRFWIVTSSALVGSSATRSFGCGSTASPMSTRCSIPPESWCGYESYTRRGSARPTRSKRVEDRFALCARSVDAGEHCGLVRLRPDRAHRVERVRGVLRHEPDLAAAQRTEAGFGQREDLGAVEGDLAAWRRPPARQQPQHRAGDRRLARTRFADQREAAAVADRERDVGDHLRGPVGDGQVLDAQQRRGRRGRCGVCAHHGGLLPGRGGAHEVLRSHRLIRLIDRTVRIVTIAGQTTSHGERG